MEAIRLLIADDHPRFRTRLRELLGSIAEMEVVAEAATGEEAMTQAARLLPDVILMDLQMPGVNGIEATRQILSTSPHIGILVLTMFADDDSVFAALRAGARGYLLKGADQEEIVRAIKAVSQGEAIFSPSIAQRLIHYFQVLGQNPMPKAFPELTEREREVLTLIAQGRNNLDIAACLVISPKTVRNHISNIFNKLQVVDRAQAIIRARDAGLGKEG
jgi:DNA-binding NarL/FixJ family response regulator